MHRKLPGTITHGRRNVSRTQRPWLDPEAFIQQALELLASDRYLQKGMGLMALTGRRPAEIFFSLDSEVELQYRLISCGIFY